MLDRNQCSASHSSCFTPSEEPHHPLNRRVGGPRSWAGCFGPGCSGCSTVTIVNTLHQQLQPNSLYCLLNKIYYKTKYCSPAITKSELTRQGIDEHSSVWIPFCIHAGCSQVGPCTALCSLCHIMSMKLQVLQLWKSET